jgi:hypothetical protein
MAGPTFTFEELETRWNRAQAMQRKIYTRQNGNKIRQARASETITTMRVWYQATSDAAFAAAIRASQMYGFDRQNSGSLKQARNRAVGYDEEIFLANMEQLMRSDAKRSIRNIAAHVAVIYFVPGTSFDSVVKRLARAYRRAHPPRGTNAAH